jgi:hypothetical protein
MTKPSNTTDEGESASQSLLLRLAEVALILLVFFVVAGDPPPHVNEAHYVCRLKHFWNPAWCAGDLFLESQDSQYVFIYTFGWVTKFLSLAATAWVGRTICWTFLAYAWQRLSWRIVPRPFAAVLSAALFLSLNATGHLAGEWIVGGIESKCVAYGFVLLALRDLVEGRWNRVWIFLGAATAFHSLVGGWSLVLCALIWLFSGRRQAALFSILPGAILGGLLALVGLVPAFMLTWNEPPELVAEAGRIYVFDRLPHHLAPLALPRDEVIRRTGGHVLLLLALWVTIRAQPINSVAGAERSAAPDWTHLGRCPSHPFCVPSRNLVFFALGAALLAAIGFAIELALWNDPTTAAKLLRYYWFRLTDFAAPMATAICLVALTAGGLDRRRNWAVGLLIANLAFAGWFVCAKAMVRWQNPIPPADQKLRDVSLWDDVCQWAAKNTPQGALFLTPRLNVSFKWRAGRPEVVNRKDVPQDARSIVEWHRRIQGIYYATVEGELQPLDSLGVLGTERVLELAKAHGAKFVLMDRGQLLKLPIAYWNDEYVIYRVAGAEAQRSPRTTPSGASLRSAPATRRIDNGDTSSNQ